MASNPKGLKVTMDEVSQEFDLQELTGVDVSRNKSLFRAIQQDIIDYTLQRAADGKGIGGSKLKTPYSESYANSTAFKAAGKSKNQVNMRLFGDMLGSMDVLDESGPTFKIGFVDQEQNVKAFAHMTGFEGHPTITKGPKRQFFGVTRTEIKKILESYEDEIEAIKTRERPATVRAQPAEETEQSGGEFERFLRRVSRITDIVDVSE